VFTGHKKEIGFYNDLILDITTKDFSKVFLNIIDEQII
jgi:hypothetical protein